LEDKENQMYRVLSIERTPLTGTVHLAHPDNSVQVIEGNAAEALADIPDLAQAVFITVEDNNIRYWINGTDPATTRGHLLVAASYQNLYLANRAAIEMLRMICTEEQGTATIYITWYGEK